MQKRKLGNSELEISPLVFGGNVFGWTVDEPASFILLDAFVSEGFNLVDSADVYSRWAPGNNGGESETIIGRWLKRNGKRNQVLIATKVGKEMGRDKRGLSKSYILRAAESSLQRLQTDHIDLYFAHEDDQQTPLEETLEAFDQLIKQGKVRAAGASNYGAQRLAKALQISAQQGYAAYCCVQPLYNLYDRAAFENDLEPLCRTEELGVITYFSLASGFLTGKYRSPNDMTGKARGSFVEKYLDERGGRILEALDQVAKGLGTSPAELAIAWLVAQPSVTAPIASATNLQQLRELMNGARLQLDRSSMELLNQASA